MTGQKIGRILDPREALQHRLKEVARDRERNQDRQNHDAPAEARALEDEVREDHLLVAEPVAEEEEDDDDHVGADHAFPGLLG